MSSRHRAAAKERRARDEQARAKAEADARSRRRWQIVMYAASAALIGLVGYAAIFTLTHSSGADSSAAASSSATATATSEEIETATGWGASPSPPPSGMAEDTTWTATISTNLGDIVVELDGEDAPQAVSSFLALAEDGFYDSTECHRLTTSGIYVLQCGDPLGTGAGGPSYRFGPIENAPEDGIYTTGTLAMARVGSSSSDAETAASSMGSQFFIVYEDSEIPEDEAGGYTVFGRVVSGLGIVESVAEAGTITGDTDGRPALSVIVNEVSVS
ncbi:peptidylprolyl isomerase [Demequina sp. NBRC 110054]|uniref:peptidylprolyl isomerase n=1 Tax=Demequina sp. NBRC 110054 TaxID=1570343 RepID=UPI001F1BC48F|nr:peptidylprolyl isomerase [Demequina sp. NBRC 110054]